MSQDRWSEIDFPVLLAIADEANKRHQTSLHGLARKILQLEFDQLASTIECPANSIKLRVRGGHPNASMGKKSMPTRDPSSTRALPPCEHADALADRDRWGVAVAAELNQRFDLR